MDESCTDRKPITHYGGVLRADSHCPGSNQNQPTNQPHHVHIFATCMNAWVSLESSASTPQRANAHAERRIPREKNPTQLLGVLPRDSMPHTSHRTMSMGKALQHFVGAGVVPVVMRGLTSLARRGAAATWRGSVARTAGAREPAGGGRTRCTSRACAQAHSQGRP